MCNCGKNRILLRSQSNALQNNHSSKIQSTAIQKRPMVMFQYTGNTALSVIGSVTRKSYRFNFPGDIQHIESIVVPGIIAIPLLKKIS